MAKSHEKQEIGNCPRPDRAIIKEQLAQNHIPSRLFRTSACSIAVALALQQTHGYKPDVSQFLDANPSIWSVITGRPRSEFSTGMRKSVQAKQPNPCVQKKGERADHLALCRRHQPPSGDRALGATPEGLVGAYGRPAELLHCVTHGGTLENGIYEKAVVWGVPIRWHFNKPSELMNPTYHRPLTLRLPDAEQISNDPTRPLFNLGLCYRTGGDTQWFLRVYVPETLRPSLLEQDVQGIHIETLKINSLAQRSLPGHPDYIVLGITTKAGQRLAEIPAKLQRVRRNRSVAAAISCVGGAALLLTPLAWLGALALLLGYHNLRVAQDVRVVPFWVLREHC